MRLKQSCDAREFSKVRQNEDVMETPRIVMMKESGKDARERNKMLSDSSKHTRSRVEVTP